MSQSEALLACQKVKTISCMPIRNKFIICEELLYSEQLMKVDSFICPQDNTSRK